MRLHNVYSVIYNKLVFDLVKNRFGEGEAIIFARASHAGGQRFPVHWGGDCESTYQAMAETIRGGLSITLSGFAFHAHDIGGFEGRPPPDVYNRWIAYGLFSSHSRLHGSHTYRGGFLNVRYELDPVSDNHASQSLGSMAKKQQPIWQSTWKQSIVLCRTSITWYVSSADSS